MSNVITEHSLTKAVKKYIYKDDDSLLTTEHHDVGVLWFWNTVSNYYEEEKGVASTSPSDALLVYFTSLHSIHSLCFCMIDITLSRQSLYNWKMWFSQPASSSISLFKMKRNLDWENKIELWRGKNKKESS